MQKPLRVLNVEDSERDEALLKRHLVNSGYEITAWQRVDRPGDMMTALTSSEWDIILCDYAMPHFDALKALAVLRQTDVDIPFIIISGTVGEQVAVQAMLTGAHDYLSKENLTRLVPAIERELKEASNRRELREVEVARQISEARYRALFDYAPDGIIISSANDYYLDANASMCQMLGYEHQELVGMHAKDIVIRSEARELESEFELVKPTPDYNREWHFKRKDGTVFPADVIATIMPDGNLLALIRDSSERTEAEDKLRESEHLLAASQRTTHLGSWVMELTESEDGKMHKERWSDEHYRIFGFEPGEFEITDENFYRCVHPDDRDRLAKNIDDAFEKHKPFDLEHRIIRPDGSERIVHAMAEVVVDPVTGKPQKVVGSVQDITDRKIAEETLKASEERYRELVENALDIIYTLDREGNYTSVNKAAERITGFSKQETLGRNITQTVVREDQERGAYFQSEQLAGRDVGAFELEVYAKDGRQVALEIKTRAITENDVVVGVQGIARDITERKLTQAALTEAQELYRELVENALDIIYTHDLEGNYTSANKAAETVFGYSNAEILAMNIADTLSPEQLDRARQMMAEEIAGAKIAPYELEIHAKDGHGITVEISTRVIYENDIPVGIQGIARDITERKITQAALTQSEERYRDLVENALDIIYTHDLKGNYTSVNKAAVTITGYTHAEILAKNIADTIPPGQLEKAKAMIGAKLAGEERTAYELELLTKDGHGVQVEVNTRIIYENGIPVGVQGIARDVSERTAAEAARLASERKYQALVTLAPVGIYQAQPNGSFMTANAALASMLGYDSVDELLTRSLTDIYFSSDERDIILDRYQDKGLATDVDLLWRQKDGSPIWIQLTCHAIKGPDGATEYFEGFVRDVTRQKSVEQNLRESDEKFHQLADNISDVFWIRSPDMSKIYYISPAFEQIWGRKLKNDHTDPHEWQDFIIPQDRQRVKDAYAGLMKDESEIEVEFRILRPDGEQRWVRARGFQVKDASGEVIRLAGIVTDITAHKRSEQLLIESRRSLALATQSANIGIWDWNLIEGTMKWDARMYELYGNHDEDFSGPSPTWNLNLHPDDIERVYAEYAEAIKGSEDFHSEFRVVWPDGQVRHLESSATILRDESGKALHFIGVNWDITERKVAEETLRELDQRAIHEYGLLLTRVAKLALALGDARDLETVFEHLREFAFVSTEMDGLIISLFDAKQKTRTAAYVWSEGVKVDISVLPTMEMSDSPHSRSVLTGEIIITNDYQSAMAGQPVLHLGGDLPQSSLVVPMSVMGKIVGGVEVQSHHLAAFTNSHATALQMAANLAANAIENVRLLDNERVRAEQLRQGQKMEAVGVLAGGIAHDFNNLLTAINGFSDMTLRKMEPDDPFRRNIQEVSKAGNRAAELTGQLLAFSRKQTLVTAVINLNSVVSNIEAMLRRVIRESIELRAILDPDLGNILADQGQIEQVIMNLAINARDAMPDGGYLTIETKNVQLDQQFADRHMLAAGGDFIRMTVSDTGEGMDAKTQSHIFEPFFTTKEVGKGTGLGLATVYGIVQQSGGAITVYSELGHGSSFKIYLPCIDQDVDRPLWPSEDGESNAGTETILLVEDEDAVRNFVAEVLEGSGYNVLAAESGPAALKLCGEYAEPIHLLISDVIMPKMGGAELKNHVVGLIPDIKVLFISGYTDNAIAGRGIDDRSIAFLEKPFTPDSLVRKVRGVLDAD